MMQCHAAFVIGCKLVPILLSLFLGVNVSWSPKMNAGWTVLLLCSCVCSLVTGFVVEELTLCEPGNAKGENVTFNYFVNFNRQPIVIFDKDSKMFVPSGPYQVAAVISYYLNINTSMVENMQEKEKRCKMEVVEYWESTVERTAKPSMKVFLPDAFRGQASHTLICQVWGFYPSDISVSWVKNDRIVLSNTTDAIPAGDWTYQVVAKQDLKDLTPDDEYTCVVMHPTLDEVMTMSWKQGLTSSQIIKISISSVIFSLGFIVALAGFFWWTYSKRSGK
ncbi:MHC class II H2-M beta 2 chain [Pelobates cultripes]|uniref:MHC class II H2-M beta 2 chain n=1 Tax=Pelobates cultripes TaxID=61616 RepID=A0AAD1SYR2_PELCU|nr:MHC class II H2-M beta 2 chain [Pelobates cultripes]